MTDTAVVRIPRTLWRTLQREALIAESPFRTLMIDLLAAGLEDRRRGRAIARRARRTRRALGGGK